MRWPIGSRSANLRRARACEITATCEPPPHVALVEDAASDHGNAHRLEVTPRDRSVAGHPGALGIAHETLEVGDRRHRVVRAEQEERPVGEAGRERQPSDGSHARDSGDSREPLVERVEHRDASRLVGFRLREVREQVHGDDALGAEARLDVENTQEAAGEEREPGEQKGRHRRLHAEQGALGARARRGLPGPSGGKVPIPPLGRASRGHDGDDESGGQAQRQAESEHRRVDRDLRGARQALSRKRLDGSEAPRAEREPGHGPGERQDERLREDRPEEVAARGSEGRPDRELAPARGDTGEREVGDVGRGDEHQEADGRKQHEEGRPDAADQCVPERPDRRARQVRGLSVLAADARRDRPEIGPGRRE